MSGLTHDERRRIVEALEFIARDRDMLASGRERKEEADGLRADAQAYRQVAEKVKQG